MHYHSELSDIELTTLLKNSDRSAYTVIYHRYFDWLYIHAVRRLNNKEEAQDIVHELFAQLCP